MVSKLETRRVEEGVVELLEDMLERARNGEIVSIAIAGIMNQGHTFEGVYVAEPGYPQTLLGTLDVAKQLVIKRIEI